MDALRKTTGCWLLSLRADLDREKARAYWRGPHAQRVGGVPGLDDYRQLHFSAEDHGFWPAQHVLGTSTPPDWRIDGMAEVAYARAIPSWRSLVEAVRSVFPDEANAFERVLANVSGPGGGRWFTAGDDSGVAARAVVLLRRRPGVGSGAWRAFVHETLGAALSRAAGALEVRTHAFLPYSRLLWPTPGVAHDNPPHRRYHGAVVLGASDRAALEAVIHAPELEATRASQARHCVALHAYAVEETVELVKHGRRREA